MQSIRRAFLLSFIGLVAAACGSGGNGGMDADAAAEGRASSERIGGESGTELADEQVLHIGNYGEPQSIDPHTGSDVSGSNIQRDLYEGLVGEAPNGDLVHGAAESWTASEDGLTYTFELRRDARWSNGDSVTAHDFVYGLRRSLNPETLSRYTFILSPIENAEAVAAGEAPLDALGARAIDDYTLEIRLANPTPYFLGLLTHSASYPVHRESVETYGGQHARPGNMVTNGAFALDEWVVQSHIKLVRNAHYWDNDNTVLEEVWFYPTENQTSELQRFRAGDLDITHTIPKSQIGWIRDNRPDDLVISPYLGSYYFGLNLTKPPLDNPELRRALSLAIDRDIIVTQIMGAGEIAAYGWVPPVANYEGQQMKEASWTQAEREAEAQRLYEQAGYSVDEPLELEILYNTEENHRRVAIAIASMWSRVLGVDADILNQEWKVFLDTRERFDTQVYRSGWIGDYNDAYTFAELFQTGGGLNNTGYTNPEYDRYLEAASEERDLERRAEHLQQAERILLEDMPLVPIYFYVTARMVAPWVGGYEDNIMDHHHHKDFFILKH